MLGLIVRVRIHVGRDYWLNENWTGPWRMLCVVMHVACSDGCILGCHPWTYKSQAAFMSKWQWTTIRNPCVLSSPTSCLKPRKFSSFHAVELFKSRYLTYQFEIQRSVDYEMLGESECHHSQKVFFLLHNFMSFRGRVLMPSRFTHWKLSLWDHKALLWILRHFTLCVSS